MCRAVDLGAHAGGVTGGDGGVVGVAVAVEGLGAVGCEDGIDADELTDAGVVFAGADVGQARRSVGRLAEERLVVRPSSHRSPRGAPNGVVKRLVIA